jgi:hypothetical protein
MTDSLFNIPFIQDIFKIFFVTGGLFYVIYSFIVLRQIQNMRHTLITSISGIVYALGLFNLALSIALLAGYILFL